MADIQHASLSDPLIHEPKDITGAAAGTAYISNGSSSGSWSPITVAGNPITVVVQAQGDHNADQGPALVDVAHQILFGAGGTITGNATINPDGSITINTSGSYLVNLTLTYGRTTGTGTAQVSTRLLVNDVQQGFSADTWLGTNDERQSTTTTFYLTLVASDDITIEFIRDSAGTNDGGLFARTSSIVGWNDIPSASISIYRTNV